MGIFDFFKSSQQLQQKQDKDLAQQDLNASWGNKNKGKTFELDKIRPEERSLWIGDYSADGQRKKYNNTHMIVYDTPQQMKVKQDLKESQEELNVYFNTLHKGLRYRLEEPRTQEEKFMKPGDYLKNGRRKYKNHYMMVYISPKVGGKKSVKTIKKCLHKKKPRQSRKK